MTVLGLLLFASGAWALLFTRRLLRLPSTLTWMTVAGALWLVALCWIPFGVARGVGLSASPWIALPVFLSLLAFEHGRDRRAWAASWQEIRGWLHRVFQRPRRAWTLAGIALLLFHGTGHYWHCLREADGGYWSAGAGWEDQSFHTALATSFALGDNLTRLSYPHLPAWPLGYPFLPDFQAGWFYAAGLPLPLAFWLGNTLASGLFLLAAWSLLHRWLQTRGAALLALVLWHLAGGWGLAYLFHEWSQSGSFASALWAHDYANDWALELHFHNLVTAIVWPMRVVLYGLAIACTLVVLLRELLARADTSLKGFVFAGALAGTLPLIGAHALVVLACAVIPLALFHRPYARLHAWCAAAAAGALFTLPQLFWMRQQLGQSDPPFLRIAPGWMAGWGGSNPLGELASHWAWNTGAWVTLGFAAWFFAGRHFRRETVGWWAILPIGFVVVFQPYVFDNLKLFAAAALAAAAGCAWWVRRFWQGGILGRGVAVGLFFLFAASGLQSIVSEARTPAMIVDAPARTFAREVAAQTPRDALILTGPQLNHPVLLLSGRRVVAANHSGLTLHGVPHMLDRTGEVARIYAGEPDADDLLRKLQPQWIVIGPMERVEFPRLNEAYLHRISERVLQSGPWELRRIGPTPRGD